MGTPTAPTVGAVGLNGPGTSAPSRAPASSGRDGSPTGERRALTQTPAPPQPPPAAHTRAERHGRLTRASAIGPTAHVLPTVHQRHAICAPKGGVHGTPPPASHAPPTSPSGADRPPAMVESAREREGRPRGGPQHPDHAKAARLRRAAHGAAGQRWRASKGGLHGTPPLTSHAPPASPPGADRPPAMVEGARERESRPRGGPQHPIHAKAARH